MLVGDLTMKRKANDDSDKSKVQWWKIAVCALGVLMIAGAITYVLISRAAAGSTQSAKVPSLASAQNRAPIDTAIIGARELKPASEANLTCAATDPDGDKLNYAWSTDSGTIKGEGNQVIWVTPETTGDYTVTAHVTDGRGGDATATKSFKVVANPFGNDSPDTTIYLRFTIPSGTAVQESRTVRMWTTLEIQCVVENVGASELAYKWTSPVGKLNGNGITDGKASRAGWIAPGTAGTYTVGVTVTDKAGNEAKGKVVFEVWCCKDPASAK
jgi:hypothetical protein